MAHDPFVHLDATAQAELVRRGEASPIELVDAAITRLERLQPTLNVVAAADLGAARQRALRMERGAPFAGVPFLVKDLLPWPGLPMGCGSRLLSGQPSPPAPPLARALEAAGLVALGKATTSEFGLLGTTETRACGPTRNPWDPARSAAGSSGGSAAAVAAGIVPVAHASDGGGSIRIPASVCGVFGFKPGRGRMLEAGIPLDAPLAAMVVDHCVSRSVRDSARLLGLTQRRDDLAPFPPLRDEDLQPGRPGPRLRVGVFDRTALGLAPHPEVAAALAGARGLLERLGHVTVDAPLPPLDAQGFGDAFFLLAGASLAPVVGQVRQAAGPAALAQLLEPFTLELVAQAERATPAQLAGAAERLRAAGAELAAFVATHDALLSPTIPILPFPLGELSPERSAADGIAFASVLAGYTAGFSAAGVPAMSVPLHWTAGGLPVGVQLAAPAGAEARLLALAYELEATAPWSGRTPPLSALAGDRG